MGECLYTASQIDEKDPESWVSAWTATAQRVEEAAAGALAEGEAISAHESYLRAMTYYRAANFLLPPDERLFENWEDMKRCFCQAAELFQPAIEPVEVEIDEWKLGGYFMPASKDGGPRPTQIMIGGGELYAEELYFWTGAVAKRRGYNMLQIALPAQPAGAIQGVDARKLVERYGVNGMIQRAVRAYTDYLTSRPDVDAERIVAYGISGGGYYIMAAAADNPHLSAIVASTPIIDMHKIVESEWPPVLRKVPSFLSNAILGVAARVNPVARVLLQKILWAGGTNSVGEYIQLTKGETEVDAREITIPVLCMAAAGDPKECIRQTHETYDLLPNPKKAKHIFSPETGADAHCHVNNLILANQIIFDWFDAVLN